MIKNNSLQTDKLFSMWSSIHKHCSKYGIYFLSKRICIKRSIQMLKANPTSTFGGKSQNPHWYDVQRLSSPCVPVDTTAHVTDPVSVV